MIVFPVRVATPKGGCVEFTTRRSLLGPSTSVSFSRTEMTICSPTATVRRSFTATGASFVPSRWRTEIRIEASALSLRELVAS